MEGEDSYSFLKRTSLTDSSTLILDQRLVPTELILQLNLRFVPIEGFLFGSHFQ